MGGRLMKTNVGTLLAALDWLVSSQGLLTKDQEVRYGDQIRELLGGRFKECANQSLPVQCALASA